MVLVNPTTTTTTIQCVAVMQVKQFYFVYPLSVYTTWESVSLRLALVLCSSCFQIISLVCVCLCVSLACELKLNDWIELNEWMNCASFNSCVHIEKIYPIHPSIQVDEMGNSIWLLWRKRKKKYSRGYFVEYINFIPRKYYYLVSHLVMLIIYLNIDSFPAYYISRMLFQDRHTYM